MKCAAFLAVCWLGLVAASLAKDPPSDSKFEISATVSVTATSPTTGLATAMTEAAQKFLASLSPAEKAKATMKFDDPARLDWHNIPKPQRKGLQVREMSSDQRKLCHDLLRAALSPIGYEKAVKIMSLENNLREGERNQKNGQLRDPERYFLTIFGQPESAGEWGWSFEGHHFSLNFVIRDGQIASDTPSFFGANPATVSIFVPDGPENGTRTLTQEEQLAFDLVNSLSDAERKKAIVSDKAPDEYRNAGKPQPPLAAPEGLPAAEMTDAHKQMLWTLLDIYNNNLAAPLAANRLAEVKAQGLDRVCFAWFGGTKSGEPHYYRVQGPTFVLELINVQSDPAGNKANHIHSVWRNLKGDFGVSAN